MAVPTVLFLPGLLEDADAFQQQIDAIGGRATCVVADLTRSETIAALAKDALAQARDAERFSVVGHSMGGYVALELMRQAPGRVQRLALVNTHARPDSPESKDNRKRLMALSERDFPAVIATLIPKIVGEAHRTDDAVVGTITEMGLAIGRDGFLRQERAIIRRIDSRPHLVAIQCPTLVIASRDDGIMPVAWLEELAHGIAGARLEVIERCGHMSTLERPGEVSQLLTGWLDGA